MKLGWAPWTAVPIALAVATLLALVLGLLSARSTGIYFLMLTLTYAVIGFYFFGQVTTFSGFGGMTGNRRARRSSSTSRSACTTPRSPSRWSPTPDSVRSPARRSGWRCRVSATIRSGWRRSASTSNSTARWRSPWPGFVAGVAGVLNIWWNGQIDPTSIGIGPTLDLFIIAVIGGIMHLEGAWLGAFVFVGANIYLRDIPLIGRVGGVFEDRLLAAERFNTVIGVLLLVIMLVSPDGLAGIIVRARNALLARSPGSRTRPTLDGPPTPAGAATTSPLQPPATP